MRQVSEIPVLNGDHRNLILPDSENFIGFQKNGGCHGVNARNESTSRCGSMSGTGT